jgi:hypothetical protein
MCGKEENLISGLNRNLRGAWESQIISLSLSVQLLARVFVGRISFVVFQDGGLQTLFIFKGPHLHALNS